MDACKAGETDVVVIMIDAGADVNFIDKVGLIPFYKSTSKY